MPASFLRILLLTVAFSELNFIFAQDNSAKNHRLSLMPAYTYYGSIDEIHSPYRYEGKNYSMRISYTIQRNTKIHVLALNYGTVIRYPPSLPVSESIVLQSHDNSRGSYIWPTTSSFLKKQTHWIQQTYSRYYRLPWHFLSGYWHLGYTEDLTIVYCPNLPMLELFSFSIGHAAQGRIPLSQNFSYELNISLLLLSLDVRNSYATVDGYVGEEKNITYCYDYLIRHARIHGTWNHTAFSVYQGVNYRFNPKFTLQMGHRITYRSLALPRLLKSMIINYQIGLQYAW